MTDLFDSIATLIGVSQATGLVDRNGEPKNLDRGLLVDAFATMLAAPAGTSAGTAYIESAAGIEAGARTGLASVITALCFLPCFFLAPLARLVPIYATAPVLVFVGALMFRSVTEISWKKLEDALPAFITILVIPLTFSITQGIIWGFLSHTVLHMLFGRIRDVSPVMWMISFFSAALLAFGP